MDISKFFSKVYLWMFVGLAVTFITGAIAANTPALIEFAASNGGYFFLIVVELGLVFFLASRVHKMKPTTAILSFVLYAFVSGLTFSFIFIAFNISSIILVFLVTSIIMLLFSLLGYFTKMDLTKIGNLLLMMLLGIIIISVINMVMGNTTLDLILCIVSIIVFVGFIAYDVNKLKRNYDQMGDSTNLAIMGALDLYLDFINIFLNLLHLFGDRD